MAACCTNHMPQIKISVLGFCDRASWANFGVREKTNKMLTPYKAAPQNRYQPHPAEAAQHNTCSNLRLVLLKMGIMMPETCWEIVKNKHLTVASCWFSLSLHNKISVSRIQNLFFLRQMVHIFTVKSFKSGVQVFASCNKITSRISFSVFSQNMNKNFQDKRAASLSAHGSAQVAISNLPKTQT